MALLLSILLIALAAAVWLMLRARNAKLVCEKKLAFLEASLAKMRDESQQIVNSEKIAAINKFASITSHELKNPLASLKNVAYFLSKALKTDDERVKKMIGMLSTEIDRMNEMITELLDLSRVKKITRSPADLQTVIGSVMAAMKVPENIRIVLELEQVMASVDAERFKQATIILLKNAVDAMPNGGTMTVRLKKNGDRVTLQVADTGVGMDQDTMAHIFEPLFTTKTKVLGLGLTVAREIIERHNGTMSVESEKDKGSVFIVAFPAV